MLKNNIKEIAISFIQRGELNLDLMANQKSLSLTGLTKNNKLIEKARTEAAAISGFMISSSHPKKGKWLMIQATNFDLNFSINN
ncbi:hypothetical protein HN51_058620 [Arachis hypogaea]